VDIFRIAPGMLFMGILRRRAVVIALTTIIAITVLHPEYSNSKITFFGVLGTFLTAGSMALLNDIIRSATSEELDRDLSSRMPNTLQDDSLSTQQLQYLKEDFRQARDIHKACASCLRTRFICGTAVPMALFVIIPLYANPTTAGFFGRRPKLSMLEDVLLYAFQLILTMIQMSSIGLIVSASALDHQHERQLHFYP
jgi:hypothetical protein